MANSFIRLPPDSTGKRTDTELITVDGTQVHRERDQIAGVGADEIAQVKNADPDLDHHGIVTRPITVSGPAGSTASSSSLAAGASVNLDSAVVPNGVTARLMSILVASSAACKWTFKKRSGATEVEMGVMFTSGLAGKEPNAWFVPPDKRFCELAGNGTNTNFRVTVENLDEKNAANVYASFFPDEA